MRLRDYIVKHSEPGDPLGVSNRIVRKLAILSGVSARTIHGVSIGERFASRKTAELIHEATDRKVPLREMINANRKKPGPKPKRKHRQTRRRGSERH